MKILIPALLTLLLIAPVSAQQLRTVIFEGSVEQNNELPPEQIGGLATISNLESVDRFIAVVTYDETNMLAANYGSNDEYFDTFSSVEFYFLDSQGNEIPQTFPTQLMDSANGTLTGSWHAFGGPLTGQDTSSAATSSDTYFTNDNQESFTFWLDFFNNGNPLFEESVDGYIRYVEYAGTANHTGLFRVIDINGGDDLNFVVDTVSYVPIDSDEDGIVDAADSCPFSIMDETVSFGGWLETGVTNYVDESGCSIMDLYAACEAEAEAQPAIPAGPVFSAYSGPSYCETQVVYGLQSDGVIDYTEGRMLRNALNNYYRSGGNGPS